MKRFSLCPSLPCLVWETVCCSGLGWDSFFTFRTGNEEKTFSIPKGLTKTKNCAYNEKNIAKPMSKKSTVWSAMTESRWGWKCGDGDRWEWICEGEPNAGRPVGETEAYRYLGAHMLVCGRERRNPANVGGTAEVIGFCPLRVTWGDKSLFVLSALCSIW